MKTWVSFALVFVSGTALAAERADLSTLSLQELLSVKTTGATLTKSNVQSAPAAITYISKNDIERSGARNLDELLFMHVPGLQIMNKTNGTALGMRGVISDRNDKFIILVNGKIMNERTVLGGISERFVASLGDIESINVIRGPGSVIHGPGAIAGVIDIVTKNGDTFEGGKVTARAGLIEQFTAFDMQYGQKLENGASFYGYLGVDNYQGTSDSNAPTYFSHDFVSSFGPITAGEEVQADLPRYGRAYMGKARIKAHAQYTQGGLDIWARYVRGGEMMHSAQGSWQPNRPVDDVLDRGLGYQQFTVMGSYEHNLNEALSLTLDASYDLYDSERENGRSSPDFRAYREDEYFLRMLADWKISPEQELVFGIEYVHGLYGKPSKGFPNQPAFISPRLPVGVDEWTSNTMSVVMEHQWAIKQNLRLYSGLRTDDNSDLDRNWTYRLAAVYQPTTEDTLKLIYNNAARNPVEEAKRQSQLQMRDAGDAEDIDYLEFRYEKQSGNSLKYSVAAFIADHNIAAHNAREHVTEVLGNADFYGLELEAVYAKDDVRVQFAHTYLDLLDFKLIDPTVDRQYVTSHDYGYGTNFANWHNHQTTASFSYNINSTLRVNVMGVMLWGMPGGKDYAEYNKAVLNNINNLPIYEEETGAYGASFHLNAGLVHELGEALSLRLDGFNLMGLFDKKLNKRNVFLRSGQFQAKAASVAATIRYRF